jgi:hypothetical protein
LEAGQACIRKVVTNTPLTDRLEQCLQVPNDQQLLGHNLGCAKSSSLQWEELPHFNGPDTVPASPYPGRHTQGGDRFSSPPWEQLDESATFPVSPYPQHDTLNSQESTQTKMTGVPRIRIPQSSPGATGSATIDELYGLLLADAPSPDAPMSLPSLMLTEDPCCDALGSSNRSKTSGDDEWLLQLQALCAESPRKQHGNQNCREDCPSELYRGVDCCLFQTW